MKWVVRGGDASHEVEVEKRGNEFTVEIDGKRHHLELVSVDGAVASLRFPASGRSLQITYHQGAAGPSRLTAPIPGKVVAVKVEPGDEVEPGQAMVVLEAMKMENELAAEQPAKVAAVHVGAGDTVEGGELLIELE